MAEVHAAEQLDSVWEYPLFEAIYGRRSRRFGMGFEIIEGPFPYKSAQAPVALSELEEALLVAAGVGVTGAPLWDSARPPEPQTADGRTYGSTSRGRRSALFFTNDSGTFIIDPNVTATKCREVETREERARILDLHNHHRRQLSHGHLPIPRAVPPLFGHNMWDCNQPGSTLFMRVCDVSYSLIAIISQLVDSEGGRYVSGHDGGMFIVDDRHGNRPAGTQRWADRGYLDKAKRFPLSLLERQACYFMFSEPAVICHNMFLATEALGLGGWMHCGFLSMEVFKALGFRIHRPDDASALPYPAGLDGAFEGFCPPYYDSMDDAVEAALRDADQEPNGPFPYKMPYTEHRSAILNTSDDGLACTKDVCNYIYDTYRRFPATVDAMHLMWCMQAHHLDLNYYRKFFHSGAYSDTHARHMPLWHSHV